MGENDYQDGPFTGSNWLDRTFGYDPQPIPDEIQLMLCRVRQAAEKWPEKPRSGWETGPHERGCYLRFMNETAPDINSPHTLNELQDLGVWRYMTGDEILEELRSCSEGCRKLFERHINRYLGAARAYLLDVVPKDQFERLRTARTVTLDDIPGGDEHELIKNKYYALHPEWDWCFTGGFPHCYGPFKRQSSPSKLPISFQTETVLFQRIFVIQKIQALLSDADGAAGRSEELNRAGEPAAAGDGAATKRKRPGGFAGFCLEKIEVMPTEEREKFLSVNKGDSSFYQLSRDWNSEWQSTGKTAFKSPEQGVSKAKKAYRELNPELKN